MFPSMLKGDIFGLLALFEWLVTTSVLALMSSRVALRLVGEDVGIDVH